MSESGQAGVVVESTPAMSFAEFLENVPPGQPVEVSSLAEIRSIARAGFYYEIETPRLRLHCSSETCNGPRFFRNKERAPSIDHSSPDRNFYLTYICSNCRTTLKTFSLNAKFSGLRLTSGQVFKFGEKPAFGPPTPTRLLTLLGDQRETFLKGRRCESQGLGIGAFSYYRRVVEHQKGRIIEEIIKVSKKINATPDAIEALQTAKNETQFSKSVALVKDVIPHSLLISGHNPLTLLHSALSAGLHAQTDQRCLELAHDVRVVLADLSERLKQALKDEAELNGAVSRLLEAKD